MVRIYILRVWISIRESMWFVPAIMTVLAAAIAFILINISNASVVSLHLDWLLYSGNPDAARSILSTIASSMVTIAGVAFSINLVVLTLASSQYGPRLLRNFIRDRGNQIVLGTFIATFVYSLIVLLAIRQDARGQDIIPQVAIAFAFLLALASLGLLIYFINHTSISIQAETIIKSAYTDLEKAIKDYIPTQTEHQRNETDVDIEKLAQENGLKCYPLYSVAAGYIQALDNKTLLNTAATKELIVKLKYQVGDFVVPGEVVALVYTHADCLPDIQDKVVGCIIVGVKRTPEQEIEFPINQMVEIAVRALSPAVNDPHTAITCIHWIGSALVAIAKSELPTKYRYDNNGNLRIIRKVHGFERLVDFSFDSIRLSAAGNVYVSIHILKALHKVMAQCSNKRYVEKLIDTARVVVRVNESRVTEPKELQLLRKEFEKLGITTNE